MASTSNLSTDITVLIQEYYERKALKERVFQNGLLKYAVKGTIPKANSDVIHFHKWAKFDLAEDVDEGSEPSAGIAANATEVKAELTEFASYIDIPLFGDVQRIDSLIKESYPKFVEQAERTANYRLITGVEAGSSSGNNSYSALKKMYANGKSSFASLDSGDKLTSRDIQRAVGYLEQQGAPKINGSYVCLLNPWVKTNLMADDSDFRDLVKLGALKVLETNELPMWAGAKMDNQDEPFRATLGGTETTYAAAGTVFTTYVLGAGAIGVAQIMGDGIKPKFHVQNVSKTGATMSIGYRIPFAAVVLDPTFGVSLKSVSEPVS